MSTSSAITIATLTRVTPAELATLLLSETSAANVAVIDVRDSDHIGGHIKGSSWIPTSELEARIPELVRLHRDKDKVVFHCMLSQQRGPSSALKFARALQTAAHKEKTAHGMTWPEVCVLEGGFGMWAASYGQDERLTEAFVRDLWD